MSPALPATIAGTLLLSVLTLLSPAPSTAASTYLCTGYTGCERAGYSNAGYAAVNDRMYWRMYSGHNCTNYVAYRMIKAGMPAERPWSGSGMAYNWGVANASITDQTPTVGSVAWWRRNSGGVGSSGHVAYVERVISSREIIVSEDSWGGDFSWRRIVKDSGSWPSGGFIHFNDRAGPPAAPPRVLTSTAPPTVEGTPQVGTQLRARVGGWAGGPTSYAFQWLANGVAIPGATATGYTPTDEMLGRTISLRVTASRSGYQSATATSAATVPVAKGSFTVVAPTAVAGEPLVDRVLTATPGTFSPAPERAAIQWRADGVVVPGATGPTLRLDRALVGKTVTALTIARSEGYVKAGSRSAPTPPVLAGAIDITAPYAVTGRRTLGQTVTVRPGAHTPADAAVAYSWLRDGAPISGADGPSYELTAADVGHDLGLHVLLTKPSFLEATAVVPAGLVRTTPTVEAIGVGRPGKAVVKVLVTAVGAEPPPGEVVVKVAGRKMVAPVRDGRARVVVDRLPAGKHAVLVRFLGSQVVTPGADTTSVQVRP